ncbi:Mov34/MPN/PAD-1 family protein [Pleomorphomonas sp. NRK KF1]|uniref:Mov34/MPN/PAD-1 family protein n=1 Tax=Pleomorphomonas sp. NRK KF1 TaxID=2943000 RepID=UPI0035312738
MNDGISDSIEFTEDGPEGASIWLSSHAIAAMIEAATKAGRCETGGILIGRYGAEGWSADVVEATPKPKGSGSGWFWFRRSKTGLASLLESRWQAGLYYVGEWHSHPGGVPVPSRDDVRAMRRIAGDQSYHCPSPVLMILAGRPRTGWSVSSTLFRRGHEVRLEAGRK